MCTSLVLWEGVGVVNEVVVMVVGWCEGSLGCMWCGGGGFVAFGIIFLEAPTRKLYYYYLH